MSFDPFHPANLPGGAQGNPQRPVNYRWNDELGKSIPPYPLTGNAFIKYATEQQDAARIRASVLEHRNMEEDVFGFAYFRHGPPIIAVPQQVRTATYIAGRDTTQATRANAPIQPLVEKVETQHDNNEAKVLGAPIAHTMSSGAIISESNPKFREMAKRLNALREKKGMDPAPAATARRMFKPSHMVQEKQGLVNRPRSDSKYLGHKQGMKEKRTSVPNNLNSGLWLSLLHPDTNERDLLEVIDTGKVYSVHVIPAQNGYPTAAASLYFMNHTGAELFLARAERSGVWVRGVRIKAQYNNYGQENYSNPERSRVLHIRGPALLMTRKFWEDYFNQCVDYQISHVRQKKLPDGQVEMEYGFARVDGQAHSVKLAIEKEPGFQGLIHVEYGPDPCNPHGKVH